MKDRSQLNRDTLKAALSECGIHSFDIASKALVAQMCDIIGALHRLAESKGVTPEEISDYVADNAV